MKKKFHVTVERSLSQLFLGLDSEFDHEAAHVRHETLQTNQNQVQAVYIGSSGLQDVSKSGKEAFKGLLCRLEPCKGHLIIFGEKATQLTA